MPHGARGSRESYHYNIRVIWVGLAGDVGALASLTHRVEREIEPLGYPREKRAFFPHLTLARVRDDAGRPTRERIYDAVRPLLSKSSRSTDYRPDLVRAFPSFRATHLSLMRSTLAPGGAIYDQLETFPLTSK
jgi:2'-5' RNA ligase